MLRTNLWYVKHESWILIRRWGGTEKGHIMYSTVWILIGTLTFLKKVTFIQVMLTRGTVCSSRYPETPKTYVKY